MKKSCLITGAGGFVGSYAVRRCIEEGFEVHVLLRKNKPYWRLKDLEGRYRSVEGDIVNAGIISTIADISPRYIFHFATYGAYPQETDFDRMMDVNVKGTMHVLEAAKIAHTKLIINTGSSSEYGTKDAAMKETDAPQPVNDYGVTKAAASLYCQKEAKQNGLAVITFRLFSVYGPYEEKQRLVPSLVLGALDHKPIDLSSPGNVRDYVYLDDVISAYIQAIQTDHELGAIYNIGTGKEHTTKDVGELVIALTHSTSRLLWGVIKKQTRQMEPKHWSADITKAKKAFGWQPGYSLKKGLQKTIEWYKNNSSLYE